MSRDPSMPSAAENELYQDVVVEHKRAPRHFGTLAAPTHQARGHNPQCGDDLQVELRLADDKVRDIRFSRPGLRDLHRLGVDDDARR